MSEEQAQELTSDEQTIQDVFDEFDEIEEVETSESEDQEEITEAPEYSPLELEAREGGHTTKDEWTKAGKDPERWKSAHEYIQYGNIKNAMEKSNSEHDAYKKEVDKQFENLNKFHKADVDSKIAAIKAEQRQAVEEADTEAYDKAQNKLDAIKEDEVKEVEAPKNPSQNKPPDVLAWEKENKWIDDPDDPRSEDAQDWWEGYVKRNPNGSTTAALAYIDKKIAANYGKETKSNPRRDAPSETGRSPVTSKKGGKISFNDLTQEEKNTWNNTGDVMWGGDLKAYLRAAADSKRGL